MLKDNLKKFRKACGFKQEDVARVLGVDRSAYSYYENGKTEPNVNNLIKIARMFQIDVDTLVGNDEHTQCCRVANATAEYTGFTDADIERLGKCSLDERVLVAWFRQLDDKQAAIEMIREQYKLNDKTEE